MLAGIFLSLYSFRHHRYMYKRLTAGLMALVGNHTKTTLLDIFSSKFYSMTPSFPLAMCILVVIEVLSHSINEWQAIGEGPGGNAKFTGLDYVRKTKYGYSTILAWFVFGIYVIAALVFLIGGRKQKGLNAATQELEVEDRPVNLGK